MRYGAVAALARTALEYGGLAAALAALIAVFAIGTDHFFTATTLLTVLNQIPTALVLATGMTFILIAGGIDLSVGSVLGLCGAVLGVALVHWGWPLPIATAACIAAGALCGAASGWVISRWRLPPFIVTLGALEAARGGAYLLSGSRTQYIGAPVEALANANLHGISVPFLIALATVALAHLVLAWTPFGRHIAAAGANPETARLSGIPVARIQWAVYAIGGATAGIAAVLSAARLGAANPNDGIGFELNAIAAAVIGGTSLAGGRGSAIKTCFGVLIIATLATGLTQAGAGEPAKRLVTGAVIVAAVLLDHFRRR